MDPASLPALRALTELLWPVPIVGVPAHQLAAALLLVGALPAALRGLRTHPHRTTHLLWLAWLGVAALRADAATDGLRQFAILGTPAVVALAIVGAHDDAVGDRVVARFLVAAALPVAWALLSPVGEPGVAVVEHGIPRNLGPYQNVHNHALVAALTVALAGTKAVQHRGRHPATLLALAAAAALVTTSVRTGWAFLALYAVAYAGRRALPVLGLGAAALAVALPSRWADLHHLLTLSPPPGGWGALGTHRGNIWWDSLVAWSHQGPEAWLLGLGLGDHLRFWKPIDPHQETLSLWFQAGLPAVLLWHLCAWHGLSDAAALRRDPSRGLLAKTVFALTLAALGVDLVSNAFVTRPTLAWVLWAGWGAVARARTDASPPGADGETTRP